jgi:hypothetical protein
VQNISSHSFQVGDFVLQKIQMTKDHHKLSPTWEGPDEVVHMTQLGSYRLQQQDLEEFMASKEKLLELSAIISKNWSTSIEEDGSYIQIYPNSKTIYYCLQGFLFQTDCYDPRVGLNILLLNEASGIDMQPLMPSTKIL